MSQRRACRALSQPRSSQRYQPVVKADESKLLESILAFVAEFPRYGYRQITRLLRGDGWRVNAKRIYKIWQREGLKVPRKKAKRKRLGNSSGGILRRKAERKNHIWSVDFIFDRTLNGRALKMLVLIDEYTRECLALEVSRTFTSEDLIEVLTNQLAIRGVPEFLRSDNGPEFIATRLQQFLANVEIGTSYIEPGSPWQNGYVESFNSRLRDECLGCEEFTTLPEARDVIGRWRENYNHRRPHGSLGGLTPTEYSARCADSASAAARPTLHQHNAEPVTQTVLS